MLFLRRFFASHATQVLLAGLFVVLAAVFFDRTPSALRWPVRIFWVASLVLIVWRLVSGTIRHWSWKGALFTLIMASLTLWVANKMCLVFMGIMGSRDDRLALRGAITLTPGARDMLQQIISDGEKEGGFHPRIGWVPRVNHHTKEENINAQGFRATREYPVTPPNRDQRVLCMGDSFTLGVGVSDDQTYPAHAEKLMPGWEWLNFGIAGSCLTQSYLHYMENARKFDGKHVIIGFMTNDAQRTVNCFRPFVNSTGGTPMAKPYSHIDSQGHFSIKPNPYTSLDDYRRLLADEPGELRTLLRQDYLTWGRNSSQIILENPMVRTFAYASDQVRLATKLETLLDNRVSLRPWFRSLAAGDLYGAEFWEPQSRGFQAVCAMFDLYHEQVIKDGRIPHIVIIPGPHDVDNWQQGEQRQYQSLVDFFNQRHYQYFDFLDTLIGKHKQDLSEEALFVVRHYQGHVNRELAEKITELVK